MARDKRSKYIVGFTVHAGKGFITPNQNPINPLVVVKCCGREYRTKVKYNKLIATQWDESHSWTDIFLTDTEWDMSFITFEVQSANPFWKNDVIGQCSIQLKTLRQRKNHFLKRHFDITELNDTFTKGVLYLTVYACGPNDTPPTSDVLELLNAEEDNFQNNQIDFLSQIVGISESDKNKLVKERERQIYNLYITIYRVEDLLFKKGLRDPFVTVEFGACSMQTTIARGVLDHNFNECIRFPVVTPIVEDIIVLKLWDGSTKQPTLITQGKFSFAKVRSTIIPVRWYNFYGSSCSDIEFLSEISTDNYFTENIHTENDIYIGRILLSLKTELLRNMDQLMPAQIISAQPLDELFTRPCQVIADIYSIKGIFGKNACVELSVGPVKQRTEFVEREKIEQKCENTRNKVGIVESGKQINMDNFVFGQMEGRVPIIEIESQSKEEHTWDVIISVYTHDDLKVNKNSKHGILTNNEIAIGSRRVAYCRMSITNIPTYIENKPLTPIWLPLKQTNEGWLDLIKNKEIDANKRFAPIESFEQGEIKAENVQEIDLYSIGSSAILISMSKFFAPSVRRTKRHTVKTIEYEIRCYLYACRNLKESGKDEKTNPYVVVSSSGVYTTSSVKIGTTNPTFMECITLKVKIEIDPLTSLPIISPITVSVFSRHSWGKRYIGSCICIYDRIKGRNKKNELANKVEPYWVKLKGGRKLHSHVGDILICVDMVKACDSRMVPPQPLFPELRRVQMIITTTFLQELFMMTEENLSENIKSKISNNDDTFFKQGVIGSKIEKLMVLNNVNGDFFLDNHERGNSLSTEIKNPIIEFIVSSFGRVDASTDSEIHKNEENNEKKDTNVYNTTKASVPKFRHVLQWKSLTNFGKKEFINKTWKTMKGYNFEFFKSIALDIFLPVSPLFDPRLTIRVFEGIIDEAKLVGEFILPLVTFLPWIPDVDSADDWISAKHDFSNNIDISTIVNAFMKGTKKNLIRHFGLASIALADMQQKKEQNVESKSYPFPYVNKHEEVEELKKKSLKNQGLNQSGVPISLVKSYTIPNVYYPRISQNMFTINIHIPFHFIIVAEGETTTNINNLKISTANSGLSVGGVITTNTSGKTVTLRPSIDTTMEEFLSDIFIPIMPLRKKGFQGTKKTFGYIRGFVLLALPNVVEKINSVGNSEKGDINSENNEDKHSTEIRRAIENNQISRCYSEDVIKYIINLNTLYKKIKGDNVYPNPVRVRLYILSALALVIPDQNELFNFDQNLAKMSMIEKIKSKFSLLGTFEQNIRVKSFYISIVCGSKEENFRSLAKKSLSPLFYIFQEYNVNFPMEARFEIKIWGIQEKVYPYFVSKILGLVQNDRDDENGDENKKSENTNSMTVNEEKNEVTQELGPEYDIFIGSTVLELTDRWHSKEWRQMMREDRIPIEYRPLYKDCTSNLNYGLLQMWVEIMSSSKAAITKRYELSEPIPTEVELRVVIWGGRNIKIPLNMDYGDFMFKASLDCKQYPEHRTDFGVNNPKVQETDIHFNCRSGEPIFNWRVVYPHIVTPISGCLLQLSVYHYSSFGNHEFIGEVNLDLRKYIMKVSNSLESIDEDVELPLINSQGVDSSFVNAGSVQVTIQIIPQSEANSKKVGMGRELPNRFPKLVTPYSGRNWEDFLQLKERQDSLRPIWIKIRILYIIFAILLFFIIGAIYPALFYQSVGS
ncbi:heat shock protein DNAJ pfj4 [Cryptosporidium ryanae]|uniref:heat shock protein DNAJ pfj4 n=1 Tax=Cryptosporidium ryanae TaxID=515981 RepID=UPI00351A7979|nr:heat shock protein DNAJ pfj4 [Cryptosporidium ryanae]